MLATLSMEPQHLDESIGTARFAQRVALIRNEYHINEEVEPRLLVVQLKSQLKEMREALNQARGNQPPQTALSGRYPRTLSLAYRISPGFACYYLKIIYRLLYLLRLLFKPLPEDDRERCAALVRDYLVDSSSSTSLQYVHASSLCRGGTVHSSDIDKVLGPLYTIISQPVRTAYVMTLLKHVATQGQTVIGNIRVGHGSTNTNSNNNSGGTTNRGDEGGNERKELSEEVRQLREQLHQRENEVAVLTDMLRKTGVNIDHLPINKGISGKSSSGGNGMGSTSLSSGSGGMVGAMATATLNAIASGKQLPSATVLKGVEAGVEKLDKENAGMITQQDKLVSVVPVTNDQL